MKKQIMKGDLNYVVDFFEMDAKGLINEFEYCYGVSPRFKPEFIKGLQEKANLDLGVYHISEWDYTHNQSLFRTILKENNIDVKIVLEEILESNSEFGNGEKIVDYYVKIASLPCYKEDEDAVRFLENLCA